MTKRAQTRDEIKAVLDRAADSNQGLQIVSGDIASNYGTIEDYDGKASVLAVQRRLTAERCGGDRWAVVQSSVDGYRGFGLW